MPERCPGAQTQGVCRLRLAMADRHNSGPHRLGDKGTRVDRQRQTKSHELGNDRQPAGKVEAPQHRELP